MSIESFDVVEDDLDKGLEVVAGVLGWANSCSAKITASRFAVERYMNCR